jgi:hypothetical protein
MPKLEGSFERRERGMWYAIFEVDSGLDGKRPKPVAKVCIDEESTGHGCECEIAALSDAILVGSVGDGFFVRNPCILTVRSKFALGEFGGVVDMEKSDFGAAKLFGNGTEIGKVLKRFIAHFHEVKTYVTRITTNKKYEIFETAITRR